MTLELRPVKCDPASCSTNTPMSAGKAGSVCERPAEPESAHQFHVGRNTLETVSPASGRVYIYS